MKALWVIGVIIAFILLSTNKVNAQMLNLDILGKFISEEYRIRQEKQEYLESLKFVRVQDNVYTYEDPVTVIKQEFAGHGQGVVNTMIQIAQKESTMNPGAVGYASTPGNGFLGLFQIYEGTWLGYGCTGDIFNARDNTRCAKKIYLAEGFYPWHVYTAGLIY